MCNSDVGRPDEDVADPGAETGLSSGLRAGAISGAPTAGVRVLLRQPRLVARSSLPLSDLTGLAAPPGVAAAEAMGTLTTTMALPHATADIAKIGKLPGASAAAVSGRLPEAG